MKKLNMKDEPVREILRVPTRFPVGLNMAGDDFTFDMEISLEMAGEIIKYVGGQREYLARKYHKEL